MQKIKLFFLTLFIWGASFGQRVETVYLNQKDSTSNMYIAVIPQSGRVDSFLFLMDGLGNSPQNVLLQTELPNCAAQKGMLTIIPILKTGSLYFGSDAASQESLKEMIDLVVGKYGLKGKDFYLGGFSIGGTCAVKYPELAVEKAYALKPKAVFAIDPPLDWERYYNAAKRVVRLSKVGGVTSEVTYMIDRIEREMNGTPQTALKNFHSNSPYSFSDTTQGAIKGLVDTSIMLITEPDILWWLSQRGYDYDFTNAADQAAMINELQRMGNHKAVLVTTVNKGYRKPQNNRHPHSWSIADPEQTVNWLLSQN